MEISYWSDIVSICYIGASRMKRAKWQLSWFKPEDLTKKALPAKSQCAF